jgi:cysteine desulfurase
VVSAVEHSTVLAAARHAEADGGETTVVPVDATGWVEPAAYVAALRADTALASLQSANHEVGTVQPVEAVADACRAAGVPLHVDAAQSVGRLPLPVGWDLLTASARKWGGPTGVGILAVRTGTRWRSPLPEDEHESGRSPGPVPLPLLLAAAAALHARSAEAAEIADRHYRLTTRLREQIAVRVPDVDVLGPADDEDRLPHLVAFSCLYVAGEALASELDRAGFSVSSGSSCSSSSLTPSHVLEAMGALTHGNVRVSLADDTDESVIDAFVDAVERIVASLRANAGVDRL